MPHAEEAEALPPHVEPREGPSRYGFGPFVIDLAAGELTTREGRVLRLSPQPFRVLTALVERAGEVVSREQLRREVWGEGTHVDFEHGLNFAVGQIRQVLGDSAGQPRYVQTLPKRGYRFIAPVEVVEAPRAPAPSSPEVAPPRRSARGPVVLGIVLLGVTLMVAVLGVVSWRPGAAPANVATAVPEGSPPSLVVLPFVTLAGTEAERWVAEGLTEELTGEIGRLAPKQLAVIGSTSARKYRDTDRSVRDIGAELGVEHALEGSVRALERGFQIRVRLVKVADQVVAWSAVYELPPEDGGRLQADIAWQVGRNLALQLERSSVTPGSGRVSRVAAAQNAYLEARFLRADRKLREDPRVRELLQRALTLDEGFALARAEYAEVLLQGRARGPSALAEIEAQLARALQDAPDLPEAHRVRANFLYQVKFDWAGAQRHFERALFLDPGSAAVLHDYAGYFSSIGKHPEALDLMKSASELDPFLTEVWFDRGLFAYFARRYEEAEQSFRQLLVLTPNDPFVWRYRVLCHRMAGRWEEARTAAVELQRARGEPPARLARVATGPAEEALRHYSRWVTIGMQRLGLDPGEIAVELAVQGRHQEALDALEQVHREGRTWVLPFLRVEPAFDPLHGDPRFQALVAEIGIPP